MTSCHIYKSYSNDNLDIVFGNVNFSATIFGVDGNGNLLLIFGVDGNLHTRDFLTSNENRLLILDIYSI